jgi:uncharacterized protein (TIGR03790 family)
MKKVISVLLAIPLVWPFLFPAACLALEADELLVVANRNARGSIGLAKEYMQKRGVPEENLLRLFVTDKAHCSRKEYDRKIAAPIRKRLEESNLGERPRCIVLVKGIPLKVGAVPLTTSAQNEIDELKKKSKALSEQLKGLTDEVGKKSLKEALSGITKQIKAFKWRHNTGASVDSELMLVLAKDYPLPMWVANPFFLGFKDHNLDIFKNDVTMVSRLDAPSTEIVRRIIDDAMTAEKKGLTGKAYFDARYPDPGDKKVSGYTLYDKSIHLAADRIKDKALMPVVLEKTGELFAPGTCPQAALYCGWYSLARYVDAFGWVPGAIGYHIASSECTTLRAGKSQVWCKRMLEEGAAVTIGPVGEPYVQAFPLPEIFFGMLAEGYLSVAECYLISLPYLSWKMVLVGDPLYRPFR